MGNDNLRGEFHAWPRPPTVACLAARAIDALNRDIACLANTKADRTERDLLAKVIGQLSERVGTLEAKAVILSSRVCALELEGSAGSAPSARIDEAHP